MGCDIHMYAEKRVGDGEWEFVDPPDEILDDWDREHEEPPRRWFSDRNYDLFGWLADVRTRDVDPICQPKGLPVDVSDVLRKEHESDCGHSTSWFTVAELLVEFEKLEYVKHSGIVELGEYRRWKASGESYPNGWCHGVTGPGIYVVAEGDVVDGMPGRPHVRCEWSVPTGESSFRHFRDAVNAAAKVGQPDGVRFVFWFDN